MRALMLAAAFCQALTAFVPTTFAAPAVNDIAFFTGTMKTQGRTVALTSELQIVQFDAEKNAFLQRTVNAHSGKVETQEHWVSAEHILSSEVAGGIIASCASHSGTIRTITVGAGTFNTCAVPTEDNESVGMVWVSQVPFGIVKSYLIMKDGSIEADLELDSFQPGNPAR